MSPKLVLAISLVLAAPLAGAAAYEPFADTVVELRINDQPQPVTLIVRRDTDGTLLLSAADLKELRIKTPARGVVQVNGKRYWRIGPEIGANVTFDDATQSVTLMLPPQAFAATRTAAVSPDSPRVTPVRPGGFVNYDVFLGRSGRDSEAGGILESGLFGTHGVLVSSMAMRHYGGHASGVRLDTTWTLDFPDRLATLRVGDWYTSPGSWGRSVRYGGLQYGTNFSTQPALVTTPLLQASGEAVVPSTVDVFVNGRPVASQDVPPGPFTVEGLPAISGAGQLQMVVTDAAGRQQVIAQPYYSSTALLRSGLNEYSFEAGAVRKDFGQRSNSYGDVAAAATFRRGVSDNFTAEVHAEARSGNGPRAAGAGGAWQVGQLGVVTAAAAAGGDRQGNGWLGGLGFEHSGASFSVFARGQYASESFAQLGSDQFEERPRQQLFAGFGLNFGSYGNLQFAWGQQGYWGAQSVETLGLGYSVTLRRLGFFGLYATHATAEDNDSGVLFSWTMPFGDRRTVSSSLRYDPDDAERFQASAALQKNLGVGPGVGYSVEVSSGDDMRGGVSYQGRAGVASADYARRNGSDGARVGAVGGLAITEAGVMPSRRLDRGFAVVQVADVEGVPVLLENQVVGHTDAKGRVLVTDLRPYDRNSISIDPTAVPLDAKLDTDSMNVTPAYRSGGLVQFPVKRALAATVRVVQPNGKPIPSGARVTLGGETFPVGLNGLLYFTSGTERYEATARWHGGGCAFAIDRPPSEEPVPDLGIVTCRATGGAGQQ
jgi:outer membrane usher protein